MARVYSEHLKLNASQRIAIDDLYALNQILELLFTVDDKGQLEANTFLEAHGLDLDLWESLGSHWSNKWGAKSGKASTAQQHVLYQWYVLVSCY